ncbi:MAG TPA: DUF763 domain-containing protein, partial [Terriglobales bacterium]|nr:DUF763 domain-containing protein [Terriglobales bacterium]
FTSEPHSGIVGESVAAGSIVNLVDRRAKPAQHAMLTIAHQTPESTVQAARSLHMPAHHEVRAANVDLKRLGAVLALAYERDLHDFAELLLVEKLGPRTLQSLALIAEVVHGTPTRFRDPARFGFAHGGKDGHPFPVPLKTYDESLAVLRRSLDSARLGHSEKMEGFRRLDAFTRTIEQQLAPKADFKKAVAHERRISASLSGRSVNRKPSPQLSLF